MMYGRRVAKCHPRVEAYGAVDELNSALGLARATAEHDFLRTNLLPIHSDLIVLIGELAVASEDLERYTHDGYGLVTPELTAKLETLVREIEAKKISMKGWATPGATVHAAALGVARATCRRAERCVCRLQETGDLKKPEIIVYLNRLADLLWLFARWVEANSSDGR